jgi:hypothetical protein
VSYFAANEGDVLQARKPDVANEQPRPKKMALVLLSQEARTDPTICGVLGHACNFNCFRERGGSTTTSA